MPKLGPVSRREFIKRMNALGFNGPYSGGKHQYLLRGEVRLSVPNPHQGDISPRLLKLILREADVSRAEWERSGN
ncbi:MAG: type II toxin-antitoxin system HicA family toxin [Planctomycetota bacterium]